MVDIIEEQASAGAAAPDLVALGRLLGTWEVSDPDGGDAVAGTIRYAWLAGGCFLIQHVDLVQQGTRTSGIEVIGHEHPFGGTRNPEITSRFYDDAGNTLDYVYELEADVLTIWGGQKGSPAYYRGRFSPDGRTLTGEWVYPGGGYRSSATRRDD